MFYFFDKAVEVNIAMLHAFINIKTASIATHKLNGAQLQALLIALHQRKDVHDALLIVM